MPQGLSDVIQVEYEDVLRTDRVGHQSGRSSPAKLAKPFRSAAIKGYEYTKHLRPRGRSVFHTSAAGPVLSALDASTLRCLCCVAAPQVLTVARSSKADGKYYGWLEQLVLGSQRIGREQYEPWYEYETPNRVSDAVNIRLTYRPLPCSFEALFRIRSVNDQYVSPCSADSLTDADAAVLCVRYFVSKKGLHCWPSPSTQNLRSVM